MIVRFKTSDPAGKTTVYEYDPALPVGGLLTARQDPAGMRPLGPRRIVAV